MSYEELVRLMTTEALADRLGGQQKDGGQLQATC